MDRKLVSRHGVGEDRYLAEYLRMITGTKNLDDATQNLILGKYEHTMWRADYGGLYLPPIMGNGMSGEQWIAEIESPWFEIARPARDVLLSSAFVSTQKDRLYFVVVLPSIYVRQSPRYNAQVYLEGISRGYLPVDEMPTAIGCHVGMYFYKMGLNHTHCKKIVTMHAAVDDALYNERLLGFVTECILVRHLLGIDGVSHYVHGDDTGFAFLEAFL